MRLPPNDGPIARGRLATPAQRTLENNDIAMVHAINARSRTLRFEAQTARGSWNETPQEQRRIAWMRRSVPQLAFRAPGRRTLLIENSENAQRPFVEVLRNDLSEHPQMSEPLAWALARACAKACITHLVPKAQGATRIEVKLSTGNEQGFAEFAVWTQGADAKRLEHEPGPCLRSMPQGPTLDWTPMENALFFAADMLATLALARAARRRPAQCTVRWQEEWQRMAGKEPHGRMRWKTTIRANT